MGPMPDARMAIVDEAKVRQYLLSTSHPVGRGKAAFFQGCGFSSVAWTRLQAALRDHGHRHDVVSVEHTDFGVKDVVAGPLVTPSGRRPTVRTVWMVSAEMAVPRLVTAYPLKEGHA